MLISNSFAKEVRKRSKQRNYSLLRIPTIPKDLDQNPSRWFGKVLAEWGIKTKDVVLLEGAIDPNTGQKTPEHNRLVDELKKQKAAWKHERRLAKKENREPDENLRPQTIQYRTIHWEEFGKQVRLAERANRKLQGHKVLAVDELPRLRMDSDEEELPDDLVMSLLDGFQDQAPDGVTPTPPPKHPKPSEQEHDGETPPVRNQPPPNSTRNLWWDEGVKMNWGSVRDGDWIDFADEDIHPGVLVDAEEP